MSVENYELKPCPFCGGKAWFSQTSYGTTDRDSVMFHFSIRCRKCNASAPGSNGYIALDFSTTGKLRIWHDDRNKAIEEWNRRAET